MSATASHDDAKEDAALLSRFSGASSRYRYTQASTALPTTTALYGIGDIHGMDALLVELLAMIEEDAATLRMPATVIFLGDMVNRGPHTCQVLERLIAGPRRQEDRWIALCGNHERAMLRALTKTRDASFRRWIRLGGLEAIASYGGSRKHAVAGKVQSLIPTSHVRFLAELPLYHLEGGYLFVHAGVEPGIPLEHQDPATLLTIRKRFLKKPHRLPFTVVHGHTPTSAPLLGPRRIGVDTGACVSGILTAVAIDPVTGIERFLSTAASKTARLKPHNSTSLR
jgi:serine/threonine protein phosphatase 1